MIALHVHHGLLPEADCWAQDVEATCRRWRVSCLIEKLRGRPQRGDSVEAWARRERYAALTRMAQAAGVSIVLLAHHRRDQAETFLLQALRGGGTSALAAMPRSADRAGITWARPWLEQPREAIEAYVRRHRLKAIDDPSNHDSRFARNRMRSEVWPSLIAAFPQAEGAFADAAQRAAEARQALDEVAADALQEVADARGLRLADWLALSAGRRRLALQSWLYTQLGQGAPQSLVTRLLDEAVAPGSASWPAGDGVLRRYRGRLSWSAAVPAALVVPVPLSISRTGRHPVLGGELVIKAVTDDGGVPLALLRDCELRPRAAGQRFQRAPRTPARSLKKQFQDAGVPAWQRAAPLLFSGDVLVFVPGLGLDAKAQALPGEPRVTLEWRVAAAAPKRAR